MAKYAVQMTVVTAIGWQIRIVDADSPEQAREMAENGEGKFDCEEVEVTETQFGSATLLGEDEQ